MCGTVAATVILSLILVWMIIWSILAAIYENKIMEKVGILGWVGHCIHRMVEGEKLIELFAHGFEKKAQYLREGLASKQEGGYYY